MEIFAITLVCAAIVGLRIRAAKKYAVAFDSLPEAKQRELVIRKIQHRHLY